MHLNSPPWLENFLKITSTGNAFKFSTMVGENFENYISQMAGNAFKLSTMVGENFEITSLKWLKMHLNSPPWLEKFLKITSLK